MKIVLAKIDLTDEVLAADKAVANAVCKPSAVGLRSGLDALQSLSDPAIRCVVEDREWEDALSRARTRRSDFAPHFVLRDAEIDLLLDAGLPEAARPVFAAAKNAGAAVLQCFEEDEA